MIIVCDDHDEECANSYDEDRDGDLNFKNCDDCDVGWCGKKKS